MLVPPITYASKTSTEYFTNLGRVYHPVVMLLETRALKFWDGYQATLLHRSTAQCVRYNQYFFVLGSLQKRVWLAAIYTVFIKNLKFNSRGNSIGFIQIITARQLLQKRTHRDLSPILPETLSQQIVDLKGRHQQQVLVWCLFHSFFAFWSVN